MVPLDISEQGAGGDAFSGLWRRKSDAVDMDEMMAAMVLTSLSCSPVVQSPPVPEASFSGEEGHPYGLVGLQNAGQRLKPLAAPASPSAPHNLRPLEGERGHVRWRQQYHKWTLERE